MDKEKLLPLSGFRDQLEPNKSAILDCLKKIFQSYGYQELETPVLEKQEILLGNYGDNAQKLLYLFEDNGLRKVGLRYDLTVPLSRYVAAHYQEIKLPFKRFEIGPVFRAEKPQVGRFRQFTQADIDIVGLNSGEKEMLDVIAAVTRAIGLTVSCQINNREVVSAVLERIMVKADSQRALMRLLDKKDKISPTRFSQEFDKLDLTSVQKKAINGLFIESEDQFDGIDSLLGGSNALKVLKKLIQYGRSIGLKMNFDLSMVRGLDYYTGTIFECVDDNYLGGSLIGGGRYDSLIENLIEQKIPAVGISFGVDRIAELTNVQQPETLFFVCLPETELETRQFATELRQSGQRVEVYPDSSVELGKQLKYADKRGYQRVIVPLEDAWKKGRVEVKDLVTGRQEAVERNEVGKS